MPAFTPAALLDLNQLSTCLSLDALWASLAAFEAQQVQLTLMQDNGELYDTTGTLLVRVVPDGIALRLIQDRKYASGNGPELLLRHGVRIDGDPVLTFFAP